MGPAMSVFRSRIDKAQWACWVKHEGEWLRMYNVDRQGGLRIAGFLSNRLGEVMQFSCWKPLGFYFSFLHWPMMIRGSESAQSSHTTNLPTFAIVWCLPG